MLTPGKVVVVCGAWTGPGAYTGLPSPPPSCPCIHKEVGVGRLLVRLIFRVSPATTVIVGPGIHFPPQATAVAVPLLVVVSKPPQYPHIGTVFPSGKVVLVRCAAKLTVVCAIAMFAPSKMAVNAIICNSNIFLKWDFIALLLTLAESLLNLYLISIIRSLANLAEVRTSRSLVRRGKHYWW